MKALNKIKARIFIAVFEDCNKCEWSSYYANDMQKLVDALEFLLKTYCHPSSSIHDEVNALLEGKKAEK